jgi:aspartate ammonia-lyase
MKRLITYVVLICFLFVPLVKAQEKVRIEKDLLGEKGVHADAYYGVQTARALENFRISGVLINRYPGFVEAWAMVKLAAARANTDVGAMKKDRLAVIEKAEEAVAYKSGKGILEIIHEKKILTEAQIKELLDPVKLTGLDKSKYLRKQ